MVSPRWMSYATARSLKIHPNLVSYPEVGVRVYVIHGPPNLCLQQGTIDYLNQVADGKYRPHTILLSHAYPPRKSEDRTEWMNKLPENSYDTINWEMLRGRLANAIVDRSHRYLTPYVMLDIHWYPMYLLPVQPTMTVHDEIARRAENLQIREARSAERIQKINDEFTSWEEEWANIEAERRTLSALLVGTTITKKKIKRTGC